MHLQVRQLISDGAGKTKMRSSEFRFKPAKGWLGRDVVEKVEGWRTRVYEAAGKMVAVEHLKVSVVCLQRGMCVLSPECAGLSQGCKPAARGQAEGR